MVFGEADFGPVLPGRPAGRPPCRGAPGDTVAGVDVLAEINRIQTGRAKTTKEHKAAQRDSVNTPVIPPLPAVAAPETQANTPTPNPPARSLRRRAARRIDDADQD